MTGGRAFPAAALAAAIALPGALGAGEIFYVSPDGNDGAAGSPGAPWRTLQYAAGRVHAGDTVVARPGQYAGFDLRTSGSAGSYITFSAEAGARINADNPVTPDGINLEGASFVVIEGFEITGATRAGIRSVANDHVTIRGNRADANGRWGIFTGFSDDLLIEANVTSRSAAEHGIYVSNSGDRPTLRGNVSWGNRGCGIHMNGDISCGGDGVISDALVEANVIYGNGLGGGSGINCDGVRDSLVRNNLIYDNHASGISLYQIDGGAASADNVVVNNTIVQASDGRWAVNISDGSTGNVLRNNVLYTYHPWRGSISISSDSLAGFESDYNAVMDRFSTNGGNSRIDLAEWQGATGQDAHSFLAAPDELFVDPAGGDYRLFPSSPAIEGGGAAWAPSVDLAGIPRPMADDFDVGAYEYVPLPGDADLNGHVNYLDLGIVASRYERTGMGWRDGDFTGEAAVTYTDLGILATFYGQSDPTAGLPEPAAAVPEPAAAALLAAGAWTLFRKRRPRGAHGQANGA